MSIQSKILEVLPEEYGYVLLCSTFHQVVTIWMFRQVLRVRMELKIEYPSMDVGDDVTPEDANKFHCVQRAYENTIELQTPFISQLLLGGLIHPRIAACGGLLYVLGRIQFARGYYTGDAKQRFRGGFGFFGMLAISGCTVSLALRCLGVIGR